MRLPSILLVLLGSSVQTVGAQPQETTVPTAPFGVFDWIVLVLYLLVLVGMGYYFSRRGTSTDDFFLAGGRIPGWAAGLSIYGTSLSALTFMATPAKVYATNWVYIMINVCELLVAPIIIFYYLPFFRRLQVTSAYEYLGKRFNVATRWFGSLFFCFFQLGRMGIVVALPSIALATVTGVNVYLCILIIGLLATLYTTLGGIEAVVWTDVLQVFVLLGGALFSIGIILVEVGGVSEFMSVARANDKFHMFNWTWDYTTTAVWVVLFGNLFAKLVPFTADQTIVQRYMTTDSEEEAARSIWTAALLAVPGAVIFFSIGTALFVFYETYPGLLASNLETDAIFPFFIAQQLPAGIAGLVIAGLFAASMSSLDSSMNSIATVVVTDFYRLRRPDAPDRTRLRIARGLTLLLGVMGTTLALVIAFFPVESLWDIYLEIIGLLGGSIAGLFALGIFTKRASGNGALVGAVTSAALLFAVRGFTEVHFFLYAGIAILSCVLVGYLVSLLVPTGPEKSLDGLTLYTMGPRRDDIEEPRRRVPASEPEP